MPRMFPFMLLAACGPPDLRGDVTVFDIKSENTGTTYEIKTFLPQGWDESEPIRPVIALDDDNWFEWTAAASQNLADEGAITSPLVVSVGYGDGDNKRNRDYLPASRHESFGGGVDPFFAFLEDELMDELASRWNIDPDPASRVLVGHSFGGFAAIWGLLTGASYGGFVSLSPSLYWGHTMAFDEEAALAADGADLSGRIYLSAGARERWGLPALTLAMGDTLSAHDYPNLRVKAALHDGRAHGDVYPEAVEAGLRFTLEAP
jgi:predicted alpha/beta superfamily hydrolase